MNDCSGFDRLEKRTVESDEGDILTNEDAPDSEKRYRIIFENTGNATILIGEDTTILLANSNFERLSGYSRQEMEGKMSWTAFIADEDLDMMRRYHAQRRIDPTSAPTSYECRFKDRTGGLRDISVTLAMVPGTKESVASCMDITERKRAEKALQESEERYRRILDNMEEAYYEVDLKGSFTFFNARVLNGLGYSSEELNGLNYRQYLDEKNAKKVFNAYHMVFLTGESITGVDWEMKDKQGKKIFVEASVSLRRDASGQPTGFNGVVRDITMRKQAEEALRVSEEKYRNILESVHEGYYEVDLKGSFTFFNDSMCRMLGYTREEMMGMNYHQFINKELGSRVYEVFHNVFVTGRPDNAFDWEIIGKDGTRRSIESSVALIRDSLGVPAGFRGVVRDITEKKNLEEQFMRAQKLEAVGTLAGGIAHDFNNLLMGILGNVSLMLMDLDGSHPFFDRLKGVEEYVKRGSDLTKQLLGFARGGKYEVRPTDLGEFIRRSADMFGRTKKEIRMHCKDVEGLWTVEIDRGQMDQVLLNLFVNAWQAMPAGGDLYISTENVELDEMDVSPHNLKPGRFVKVSVTDTGIGMDEATRERIFEPFFTTKERERGTGLGLASAYGIIKNHGGFIHVESEKDLGTSFMIYLPASETEPEVEYSSDDEIRHGYGTVLLIDDEDMILDIGSRMLEGLGYKVITASGGRQGLKIFEKNRDKIDLVILDMIMPDFGGKETFETLHRIDPSAKIMLSSGYSLDNQAKEIMQAGCKGFIQKPFTMAELSTKVREILEGE